MERKREIIKASIVGIIVNISLAALKALVGLFTGSIAVILDAVNNLSDVLSSVITVIGTALAGKAPDRKHPFGHGRIEYISAVIVSAMVLVAGAVSLKESVEKIIAPKDTHYNLIAFVILGVAIAAKIICGVYVRSVGRRTDSVSLIASGTDAFSDAVLTLATLAGAVVSVTMGITIDGYLGIVISLFIIKAGIDMILSTFSSIIGERTDPELSHRLKDEINSFEPVSGVYDLTLHSYGPANIIGSVHIELPDDMTVREIHKLTNEISERIDTKYGVKMTIGVYAQNSCTGETAAIRNCIMHLAESYDSVLQVHGFCSDSENKTVSFDMLVDFDADTEKIRNEMLNNLNEKYPDYTFGIVIDSNYCE